MLGGRLAAAIGYYGFFAIFALLLVAYSVFGFALGRSPELRHVVRDFVHAYLPSVRVEEIAETSGTLGVIGVLGLLVTGIGWVEALRSSQRLIHRVEEQPGHPLARWLLDLAVLAAVLALIFASFMASDLLTSLLPARPADRAGLTLVGWVPSVLVNTVLAAALMLLVPRLRMPPRRLRWPVLTVAVGITLLNTLGRGLVLRVERNPAYTVVAGAAGVLLYLYLLNQLLLFGAALAATSEHGRVTDLTRRGRPAVRQPDAEERAAAGYGGPPAAGRDVAG